MNVLYIGRYKSRVEPILQYLENQPRGSRIVELCFGDTYIAEFCKKKGLSWTGMDINAQFVRHAQKAGHEAVLQDLSSLENLPKADVYIMIGSFYHFYSDAFSMLNKIFQATNVFVISEPVVTLSNNKGIMGYMARRAANAGKREEKFRYHKKSFLDMLAENSPKVQYEIISEQAYGKDYIVTLKKLQK